MNNFLCVASKQILLVVEPLGELGYKAASKVSMTCFVLVSITETLLSLALHTYKYLPSGDTSISLGLSPTVMGASHVCVARSKVFTLSQPQQETYNFLLSGLIIQVNASASNPKYLITFFVRRSNTYNRLSSLVTTYKRFLFSSKQIPEGPMALGHAFPNSKVSLLIKCPPNKAYLIIILS